MEIRRARFKYQSVVEKRVRKETGDLYRNERNGLNEARNQVKGRDTNGCVWETGRASVERAGWPRDCSYFQRGREERRETVYSQAPPCLHFLSERCNGVPSRGCIISLIASRSIIRSRLYREGPLWQTLVPWNIVMQRVVTDCPSPDFKSLCHCLCTPFAEFSASLQQSSAAVNRKRKINRFFFSPPRVISIIDRIL